MERRRKGTFKAEPWGRERYRKLVNMGIPTWIDAQHAIAHNKVMVIDGATVITGSFNFTKAAEENNAENMLVIRDKALADKYAANWQAHVEHSEPYEGRRGRCPRREACRETESGLARTPTTLIDLLTDCHYYQLDTYAVMDTITETAAPDHEPDHTTTQRD